MQSYPNAAKGLNRIFLSQILVIVGVVLALTFNVVTAMVAVVLAVVSAVLYLMGLYRARMDDQGYGMALTLVIVSLVLGLVQGIFREGSLMYTALEVACSALDLITLYLVCRTTSQLAGGRGREDIARQGHRVWVVNLACVVTAVLINVVLGRPVMHRDTLRLLLLVALVLTVVGTVLYVKFLYQASKALD